MSQLITHNINVYGYNKLTAITNKYGWSVMIVTAEFDCTDKYEFERNIQINWIINEQTYPWWTNESWHPPCSRFRWHSAGRTLTRTWRHGSVNGPCGKHSGAWSLIHRSPENQSKLSSRKFSECACYFVVLIVSTNWCECSRKIKHQNIYVQVNKRVFKNDVTKLANDLETTRHGSLIKCKERGKEGQQIILYMWRTLCQDCIMFA
jgi:hypothetical protein